MTKSITRKKTTLPPRADPVNNNFPSFDKSRPADAPRMSCNADNCAPPREALIVRTGRRGCLLSHCLVAPSFPLATTIFAS